MTQAHRIEQSAQTIERMVCHLRTQADQLERLATEMRSTGDLDLIVEAVQIAHSSFGNLRIDLLLKQALRAAQDDSQA